MTNLQAVLRVTLSLALAVVVLPSVAEDSTSSPLEARFRETVRPFVAAHCLKCHGQEKPEGDLDLSRFTTVQSVAPDLAHWMLVLEQLESGAMPPEKAKSQPTAEARVAVISWIKELRKLEAARNAGDPGFVPARRLSNAEYDNTIRDLTGVDLRPTKEFPVDPANKEGFDNSAESLAMSPSLVKKYLDAARLVSEHLLLKPDGLAFAPHPVLADTDRDKYCVKQIIDFYAMQKTDYADYFLAAWRFRHRAALGRLEATLDQFADDSGLSRKYLAAVAALLNGESEKLGPVAVVQTLWHALPSPGEKGPDAARAGCEQLHDFVVKLRQQLVPQIENLTAAQIGPGSQPFVLWKNRQMATNRRRYVGNSSKIAVDQLALNEQLAQALAAPEAPAEREQYEAGFEKFCHLFPDTFVVSERSRFWLGDEDKGNKGRLLSAGFHSMTGYFRDDGPLYELLLDEAGQQTLDRLWREFDCITGAPMRQYTSYLWFERAENGFLRGDPKLDLAPRAEDKDAASPEKLKVLTTLYLEKAREIKTGDLALQAIEDQFKIFAETIHKFEQERRDAEPRHVAALQDFAERAWRRPLAAEERDGVAGFYRQLREQNGLSHEDAVRDTVVSLLMSPHFCYRVDLPGVGDRVRPLSDYDLASRLSYFLWASAPDAELLSCAAAGELQQPDMLVRQARRMLRDNRVRGLATEFCGNWLDFRRFEEHNSVDRSRFPSFDDALRRAMFEEPIRFFLDVVQHDRPISEFLEGRHTFVNAPLAKHYGISMADGAGPETWIRIDDAAPYGRGGLLPMGVFLTKNSPGLRTSPVKRGYWVVKRLLGENIPAPPPNVPDLPDDEAKLGELTLRDVLTRHRADKACAGCHERFDAIGLAFEGYGPVGEARTLDLGNRPVDTRANFPGGGEGMGLAGLRDYLKASRQEEFVENLCRKLLAYGLGRSLIPSDDQTVATMAARLEAEEGRFSALIDVIVASPQFRNKRIEEIAQENR